MRRITRIVITGGPCAGKTAAMDYLRHRYMEQGFRVLCIREAATDLMSGGVTPWNCSTSVFYQQCQMELQAARERIFLQAAESMDAERILILSDRGLLDNRAYIAEDEYDFILQKEGWTLEHLLAGYDAVFFMESAAVALPHLYTVTGNSTRTETLEEAAALNEKSFQAWQEHPYVQVIPCRESFAEELSLLDAAVDMVLEGCIQSSGRSRQLC